MSSYEDLTAAVEAYYNGRAEGMGRDEGLALFREIQGLKGKSGNDELDALERKVLRRLFRVERISVVVNRGNRDKVAFALFDLGGQHIRPEGKRVLNCEFPTDRMADAYAIEGITVRQLS